MNMTQSAVSGRWRLEAAFWLIIGLSGCGGGASAVTVQGQVHFQNQPVPHGHISFSPLDKDYRDEPRIVCSIQDGQYQLSSRQRVRGGKEYRVEVGGFPRKQESEEDEVEPLFPMWSQSVVIPERGGTLDFSVSATR